MNHANEDVCGSSGMCCRAVDSGVHLVSSATPDGRNRASSDLELWFVFAVVARSGPLLLHSVRSNAFVGNNISTSFATSARHKAAWTQQLDGAVTRQDQPLEAAWAVFEFECCGYWMCLKANMLELEASSVEFGCA